MARLIDIEVDEVSLVDKAANKRKFLFAKRDMKGGDDLELLKRLKGEKDAVAALKGINENLDKFASVIDKLLEKKDIDEDSKKLLVDKKEEFAGIRKDINEQFDELFMNKAGEEGEEEDEEETAKEDEEEEEEKEKEGEEDKESEEKKKKLGANQTEQKVESDKEEPSAYKKNEEEDKGEEKKEDENNKEEVSKKEDESKEEEKEEELSTEDQKKIEEILQVGKSINEDIKEAKEYL